VPVAADFHLSNIEKEKFSKRKLTRIRYINDKLADLHKKIVDLKTKFWK
jgi:hypothetical protein